MLIDLLEDAPLRKLVALSGGVDSAVAAELMKDDRCRGCRRHLAALGRSRNRRHRELLLAAGRHAGAGASLTISTCRTSRVDLRDPFRKGVVDPYLAAFGDGLTPNPCVGCNGHVRFDALDELRARLGAPELATGHYARIEWDEHGPLLAAAADDNKDQTYMLAAVEPRLIERLEFPLGLITKPEVRERARAAGLAVAEKPESQDLCFLAGIGRDGFLERHSGRPTNPDRFAIATDTKSAAITARTASPWASAAALDLLHLSRSTCLTSIPPRTR